jgi:ribosomal protein L12E/L44/L45/RPP1/RPP2
MLVPSPSVPVGVVCAAGPQAAEWRTEVVVVSLHEVRMEELAEKGGKRLAEAENCQKNGG